MRLSYAPTATNDIDGIFLHLASQDPLAGERVVRRIDKAIAGLLQFPMRGRVGRVVGTRELVVVRSPYVVAYRLTSTTIQVLAVLDGRRRWPDAF